MKKSILECTECGSILEGDEQGKWVVFTCRKCKLSRIELLEDVVKEIDWAVTAWYE